ncbi:MAG: secretin N-terminal domain-containing protein [Kofleriaceae bacterium]
MRPLVRSSALAAALLLAAPARADRERPASATVDDDGDDAARFACGKPKASFEVAFPDEVGVKDLTTWAMGFSCKRFVYTAGIASRSAKLTMITPGKLDASAAWAMFEVALDAMGLTAVSKGPVYEIVETPQAKDAALAIRNNFPDGGGAVVRLLLRPAHVGVDDLRAALELVKSKHGAVTALPALGALLITDDGRHVARMRTIVTELDRPGDGDGVWAVPVRFRDPDALAEILTSLVTDPSPVAGAPPGPRLLADRRAGAVFVVGTAGQYQRVATLVSALDRDTGDNATMSAVRLRNARAPEVITALAPLVTGGDGKSGLGQVRLASDEATNAILIQASAQDTASVRAMLAELDAPRRQVYIEAMVLEVSTTGSRTLGTSWHAASEDKSGNVSVGGFQSSTISSVNPAASLAGASGLLAGILGTALSSTLLGESAPSFGLLVQASATSGEVEVLASPHLMMLDNKTATISVGTNIPYKSKSAATSTTFVQGEQIERQNVALTLKITPHVAPADLGAGPDAERIRLDVELEHNQIGDSDFQGLGPTWKERKLDTSVVVHDQDSVVLGGLIDERVEHSTESIPVLGDLPLLGALFRTSHTGRTKANLLIILTPHLIDDSAAGRAVFDRRMREREEFLAARSRLSTEARAPRLDYRKKRGLIAEIDATVRTAERERAEAANITAPAPPQGRVDQPPAAATP